MGVGTSVTVHGTPGTVLAVGVIRRDGDTVHGYDGVMVKTADGVGIHQDTEVSA